METKLTRRTFFLAVGTASAGLAFLGHKAQKPSYSRKMQPHPGTLHFFADDNLSPPALPRTAAIEYLPS